MSDMPRPSDQQIAEWERTRVDLTDPDDPVGSLITEVRRLRAQLPDGMQHCTLVFKECAKGHGWLTATNWVQHGCPTCENAELRATVGVMRRALEQLVWAREDWWPPTDRQGGCLVCGKWTPARHPEAHDHAEGCTAYAEQVARTESIEAAMKGARDALSSDTGKRAAARVEALERCAALLRECGCGAHGHDRAVAALAALDAGEAVSRPITDEQRQAVVEHHGRGRHVFTECALCGYRAWSSTTRDAPDEIVFETLNWQRDGLCPKCAEVQGRAPEIFQWVLNVINHRLGDRS